MGTQDRTSKSRRQDWLFLRHEYNGDNKYDIATLARCDVFEPSMHVISCKSIKSHDNRNIDKAVHFFVDDADFERFFRKPVFYTLWLAQYKHVFTPDFSMLCDMPIWMQIKSVAKNRWCGRFWQDAGISVIPTVGWSTKASYDFAFLGLAPETTVAVSTLGVRSSKERRTIFLDGYEEMLRRIKPKTIYCYCKPFPEMEGNIIYIDYLEATRRAG